MPGKMHGATVPWVGARLLCVMLLFALRQHQARAAGRRPQAPPRRLWLGVLVHHPCPWDPRDLHLLAAGLVRHIPRSGPMWSAAVGC
uniref:Putative secreted protein n=1 Tax=Ixodes ricinus TaxID=34613 RepID=A0A6B0TZC7_IXORI